MKTRCRGIDITDPRTVEPWVWDVCMRHRRRRDFRKLLLRHGMSEEQYKLSLLPGNKELCTDAIRSICAEATERIRARDLQLEPIQIRVMLDRTTGKIRQIGKESAMQQIFDYIAVYSSMPILKARIVAEQASSIPGRGQIYGMNLIRKYVRKDNAAARYAAKHGLRYTRTCAYWAKLDIRKCYPSASAEAFLRHFRRDCGNPDIVWLWETLFSSHRSDGYEGFMIGALISQWAAQYMLSFVYRFARTQGRTRRDVFVPAVRHMILFMDDMLLLGSNRKQLLQAIKAITTYTREAFGWEIKPNFHIRKFADFPIDMMGYVTHQDGKVMIRERTFLRMRRQLLRCEKGLSLRQAMRIMSYKGYTDHSDSGTILRKYPFKEITDRARKIISKAAKAA